MVLYFVGLGLNTEHLTLEAIKILSKADTVYVDSYTSIISGFSINYLKKYCKGVVRAVYRRDLEGDSIRRIVEEARYRDVVILVPGDPFIATTHDAIRLEALEKGVPIKISHGVSIYSVVASAIGLQAYRFGKTVTLVYPQDFKPYSVIEAIRDNLARNLHTLVLLDLKLEQGIAMTINEAIPIILELEKEYCRSTDCSPYLDKVVGVACARLGTKEEFIKADLLPRLADLETPPPPHSLVVVAYPHPIELDLLKYNAGLPSFLHRKLSMKRTYPLN
ncbi:MAG: diphthine synthase [Desulfurococcales archaeon]|nr:diphthine synthase [Desulfurococcales archaeon]